MTQPSCSTSADHPPAVAHVRIFAELSAGAPRSVDNLCTPCVRAALVAHSSLLASGAVASIVVVAIASLHAGLVGVPVVHMAGAPDACEIQDGVCARHTPNNPECIRSTVKAVDLEGVR